MIDRYPAEHRTAPIDSSTRIDGIRVAEIAPTRDNSPPRAATDVAGAATHRTALLMGDADAYESLVRTHGPRLRALALRYTRDSFDADDVVQDAFVALQTGLASFDGRSSVETWLHRVVVNRALDLLRKRRRRAMIRSETPESLDLAPRAGDDARSAESVAESAETYRRIVAAVDRLPPLQRVVIRLRDIEGLGLDDTAEALGIDPVTVRVRLHRARRMLRARLTEFTA